MQKMRWLSFGTAIVLSSIVIYAPLQTAAAQRVGYRGDCNQDETVDSSDVLVLLEHLTGALPYTEAYAAQFGDMNGDHILNAVDLTLLKRIVRTGAAPEPILQSELPPIAAVNPSMPTRGTVRVPMFLVSFPDCPQTTKLTAAEIQERAFRAEDLSDLAYPMESMPAYFDRASYGRLQLSGDVYTYTAKKTSSEYLQAKDELLAEMLHAWNDQIDYRNYDANRDGVMDALIAVLPKDADEAWRAATGVSKLTETFDGVKLGRRCIGRSDVDTYTRFHSTWLHELTHTMGLPDYYKYTDDGSGIYGMYGDAGWELMDDGYGDLSAFSKLMLGWYEADEVSVYTGGRQTFRLKSGQAAPQCILIPRGDLNGYMSEYFVLEYHTAAGNNTRYFANNHIYPMFSQGGLRVLHCNAELWDGIWGPELKWNNFGQMYDTSNQKQRVLRLANAAEGGAFFQTGAVVDGKISGFHWYDEEGAQTVETGVKIVVESIADGICTVTISPD